jgi:two-component SAPR family response regulator
MNGYDFVRQIKELKPSIKIILMSAFEFSDSEYFLKIDDFLEKPVSLHKLNEILLSNFKRCAYLEPKKL